jgi:osmotically-inducible protein OsmY
MKIKTMKPVAYAAVAAAIFAAVTPLRASEADDAVEASFKRSYVYRTYLKDDAVKAKAVDGVVTLTGTVADESHKTLAEDTAASLKGVDRVDSLLETKAEVAADNADGWIVRKVKLALLFHRNVNAVGTTVEATDGVVTLKGEAASVAQKELTSAYANDIEGVKEVKNEMTVVAAPAPAVQSAGEKLDDASITAQVKMALLTHRSTSSVKTKVETRDGKVTLTGIAKIAAEKALAGKLVADIQGVTDVNNEMTIAEIK